MTAPYIAMKKHTMKIKTQNLTGAALDWAVAKALRPEWGGSVNRDWAATSRWHPSTDWSQGGPIIDRKGISLRPIRKPGHELDGQCLAAIDRGNTGSITQWVRRTDWHRHYWQGPTLLIAAMRCFVASKLGNEVEVPEEVLT